MIFRYKWKQYYNNNRDGIATFWSDIIQSHNTGISTYRHIHNTTKTDPTH
jgi:hypothetical protein